MPASTPCSDASVRGMAVVRKYMCGAASASVTPPAPPPASAAA
jgi:hypothetical protein